MEEIDHILDTPSTEYGPAEGGAAGLLPGFVISW